MLGAVSVQLSLRIDPLEVGVHLRGVLKIVKVIW